MSLAPVCSCATCADEALPMRVLELDADRGLAMCEAADGQRHTVEVALVQTPAQGDMLLVHAGVAIATAGRPA